MKKKNLLILGGTSGLMINLLENFLRSYNVTATFTKRASLKTIPSRILKSKDINFLKLNFFESEKKIISTLKKNNVKADIIINATGGSFGIKGYPFKFTDWKKSLDLNILKHIQINNFFLKKMIKNKFGRILFFSTLGVDHQGAAIPYSAAKAYLENYVKKSALEFGKYNILINCVKTSIIVAKNNNWYKASISKPNMVKKLVKDKISLERYGKADDLVAFIDLIISEKNKFMNGSIVSIDGGFK